MRLPPLLVSLCTALFMPCTQAAPFEHPQFAHEKSDLPVDPKVRFGELANGMKYAVLANHEPKQRSSLRLLVMAGSLHERENQRGLAHFLEHMAFNGSTHYPPGTLIEYFQRLGMSFGGDTNAYTSFTHTGYLLELPDSAKATMQEGFRVLSDYANGLLLGEEEIDRERGIILSEKRARDSVEFRQTVAELEFLLDGTPVPRRMPIGTEEVITNAPRDRFVEFYQDYYRPDKLAVVAVGDFDAETIEALLRESFSGLEARGEARPLLDLGTIPDFEGVRTKYHHDAEASVTVVAIQTVRPHTPEPDTKARRLKYLPRDLALAMLNRRLAILAKKEDAPFIRGSVGANIGLNFFLNSSVELSCKPEQWSAALAVAEQELRRALEFGFDPVELREVTANFRNGLEQAARTASTRRSDGLAVELLQSMVNADVFTTPESELELVGPALKEITAEQCRSALAEAFAGRGRFVSVMGNARLDAVPSSEGATGSPAAPKGPDALIATAFEASTKVAVQAPEQQEETAFAYTDFGPPGRVAEQKHVDDLNLDQLRFANGVRLNFKKTDFEAGRIHLLARVGSGQLTEPKEQPGLAFYSSLTFSAGGLGKHSSDDLQRILAGKTVGLGFRVGNDALVLNGSTNQDDLLLQLQLLAAFITDPGYRPEAFRMAQKRIEPMYQQLEHTPNGPLQLEVPRILASGDPRFGLPPKAQMLERDLEESKAWLNPQLGDGPLEVSIVGDLDPAKTIEAAAATLGALPPRKDKPSYEEERQVSIPDQPVNKLFSVVTDIPKGVVTVYWPTTDARDVKRTRRLSLLANVFTDRLRVQVREKLGESYSPDAASAPDQTYRDYGFFYTYITIDPAKAGAVEETVLAIGDDLVRNGIEDDEFTRARQPILTALRESARTNSYWLNMVLARSQEYPEHLDWSRSRYSDIESISKTEVEQLARTYLGSERAFRFTVLPEKK